MVGLDTHGPVTVYMCRAGHVNLVVGAHRRRRHPQYDGYLLACGILGGTYVLDGSCGEGVNRTALNATYSTYSMPGPLSCLGRFSLEVPIEPVVAEVTAAAFALGGLDAAVAALDTAAPWGTGRRGVYTPYWQRST